MIDIDDPLDRGELLGEMDYETFLQGDLDLPGRRLKRMATGRITRRATGDPKGVVYHHRGAFERAR